MDLSKVFDTLDHKILHVLHKFRYYGIQNAALDWFSSYLQQRVQYVEINYITSESLVLTCVPRQVCLN